MLPAVLFAVIAQSVTHTVVAESTRIATTTPAAHAYDVLTFATKLLLAFSAFWLATSKVVKPLYQWWRSYGDARRRALATEMREILKPELDKLTLISTCNDRLDVVILRQKALFVDIDDFLHVARNNSDRLDEVNELLDAVGFSTDRRGNDERRKRVEDLLNGLAERQRARRRLAEAETEIEERVERAERDRVNANALRALDVLSPEPTRRRRSDSRDDSGDQSKQSNSRDDT
jgi:hypothetical protein